VKSLKLRISVGDRNNRHRPAERSSSACAAIHTKA